MSKHKEREKIRPQQVTADKGRNSLNVRAEKVYHICSIQMRYIFGEKKRSFYNNQIFTDLTSVKNCYYYRIPHITYLFPNNISRIKRKHKKSFR